MSPAEVRINVRASKEDKASVEALAKASGLTASKLVRSLAELEPATIEAVSAVGEQLGLSLGAAFNHLLKNQMALVKAQLDVDGVAELSLTILFSADGSIITGAPEFRHMVKVHSERLIAERQRSETEPKKAKAL